jgi:hypothetical protein
MVIDLPRVVQRPTPNYSPTFIKHEILIAHMMEGGYAGSVAWLCQRAAGASAHLCMSEDGAEVSQLAPLQFKAWAQCAFNGRGVSLEIPGRTTQGIPQARWRAAALIFGWLCVAYDIPPVWAKGGQGRGLCQHHDLGAAGGGHVDCSEIGGATWLAFVGMVQAARDAFVSVPLPAFALHGLANPHQIKLPPDVKPTPSHGGASRMAAGEPSASHPTNSGFPNGCVADLQWRLNLAGTLQKLVVDGFAGRLTRAAIAHFQFTHGVYVDGLMGPITWAALNAETDR